MRSSFKDLRLRQLDQSLEAYRSARSTPRPPKGWIKAMRQALGLSSGDLARRMGTSRQLPLQLEKAEADDRITLRSLRSIASAMDCDLVYALVPRVGNLQTAIEDHARAEAKARVLAVEHSMALENQAVGRIDEAIETETANIVRRHAAK